MNQPFAGFTLPDGAWLPPEFMAVLPTVNLAELKTTLAAIYETMRVGGNSVAISLSDFEALTGLSRKSVLRGIKSAVERGTITRTQAAGTYIYSLAIKDASGKLTLAAGEVKPPIGGKTPPIGGKTPPIGGKKPPHVMSACSTSSPTQESLHTASGKKPPPDLELIAEMRALGVALKVCQNIAGRYDPEYLREKLRQARHALEVSLARNPAGWFVASIKNDWPAPLGYDPDAHLTDEERRHKYISGEFSDFIHH